MVLMGVGGVEMKVRRLAARGRGALSRVLSHRWLSHLCLNVAAWPRLFWPRGPHQTCRSAALHATNIAKGSLPRRQRRV